MQWHSQSTTAEEPDERLTQRVRRTRTKKRPRTTSYGDTALPLPKRITVDSSDWSEWIELTGGRAVPSARVAFKQNPCRHWRSCIPQSITVWGDFRSFESEKQSQEQFCDNASTLWSAVVPCLTALEAQLSCDQSSQSPIFLSQVSTFLQYCGRLPDDLQLRDHIDPLLKSLADRVRAVQQKQAQLLDLCRHPEGVDVDTLRKFLASIGPIKLDETALLEQEITDAISWEESMEKAIADTEDSMEVARTCIAAGSRLGFRYKALVQLEGKLEKALELRSRIIDWTNEKTKESVKSLSILVRECQRLKWSFPETKLLMEFHQESESWIDRANIAIRSKISMVELDELLVRGHSLPVDVSDLLDKLESRNSAAKDWLDRFHEQVTPQDHVVQSLRCIRQALEDSDRFGSLHELASEGSRLPVQVDAAHWLQVEIEARTWSARARRWAQKSPKLEDLREHVIKGKQLHDKINAIEWDLPGERELITSLDAADAWLRRFEEETSNPISIAEMRDLAQAGELIGVNLGPPLAKLGKALQQAEEWYIKHRDTLECCRDPNSAVVEFSSIKKAVQTANDDLPIYLKEALELEAIVDKVNEWLETVAIVSKTKRRGKKNSITISDIEKLITDSKSLPIRTEEHVKVLNSELDLAKEWRSKSSCLLMSITNGFLQLRKEIMIIYGRPSLFSRLTDLHKMQNKFWPFNDDSLDVDQLIREKLSRIDELCKSLQDSVDSFCKDAMALSITTPESDIASRLELATRWSVRSTKYLENQRDVFDKRFYGAFDRFILEGKAIVKEEWANSIEMLQTLNFAFSRLIEAQLERLSIILSDREKYVEWSKLAEEMILSEEKKLPLHKLQELCERSHSFPNTCDLVSSVQKLFDSATDWANRANQALSSPEKMGMSEAKALCDEAEAIGFTCPDLKKLRAALKTARGWATRVRKSIAKPGALPVQMVRALQKEHDKLLIKMPEEFDQLRQTVKNYCICRRPYEGFMIECDDCGDWFHGVCIGITESKADKVDKFQCVRCNLKRTHHSCASSIAFFIRKWTNHKDLRKARQVSAQRHQRKVRRETKLMEDLRKEQERALIRGPLPSATNFFNQNTLLSVACGSLISLSQTTVDGKSEHELHSFIRISPSDQTCDAVAHESAQSSVDLECAGVDPTLADTSSRLKRISESIQACRVRLEKLSEQLVERKKEEKVEDRKAPFLKEWFLRARSILAPPSLELAKESRPLPDGKPSAVMLSLLDDAEFHGLTEFEDVRTVIDSFKCMGWTLRASLIFSRQPNVLEIDSLVEDGACLKLPDERALRIIRGLSLRAQGWSKKVMKALAPDPGESSPFDVEALRDLAAVGDDIPVYMPLESRLNAVIEDNGIRHCICGGPSDGRFMLSCDECERWFHGHCVNVSKDSFEVVGEWRCPTCRGSGVGNVDVTNFFVSYECDGENESVTGDQDDASSKAPELESLWPPFGLFGSPEVNEALCIGSTAADDIVGCAEMTCSPPCDAPSDGAGCDQSAVVRQEDTSSKLPPVCTQSICANASVVASAFNYSQEATESEILPSPTGLRSHRLQMPVSELTCHAIEASPRLTNVENPMVEVAFETRTTTLSCANICTSFTCSTSSPIRQALSKFDHHRLQGQASHFVSVRPSHTNTISHAIGPQYTPAGGSNNERDDAMDIDKTPREILIAPATNSLCD